MRRVLFFCPFLLIITVTYRAEAMILDLETQMPAVGNSILNEGIAINPASGKELETVKSHPHLFLQQTQAQGGYTYQDFLRDGADISQITFQQFVQIFESIKENFRQKYQVRAATPPAEYLKIIVQLPAGINEDNFKDEVSFFTITFPGDEQFDPTRHKWGFAWEGGYLTVKLDSQGYVGLVEAHFWNEKQDPSRSSNFHKLSMQAWDRDKFWITHYYDDYWSQIMSFNEYYNSDGTPFRGDISWMITQPHMNYNALVNSWLEDIEPTFYNDFLDSGAKIESKEDVLALIKGLAIEFVQEHNIDVNGDLAGWLSEILVSGYKAVQYLDDISNIVFSQTSDDTGFRTGKLRLGNEVILTVYTNREGKIIGILGAFPGSGFETTSFTKLLVSPSDFLMQVGRLADCHYFSYLEYYSEEDGKAQPVKAEIFVPFGGWRIPGEVIREGRAKF